MVVNLIAIEVEEVATVDVATTVTVARAVDAAEKVPLDAVVVAATPTARRYAVMEITAVD